jgi:hypothetical protein
MKLAVLAFANGKASCGAALSSEGSHPKRATSKAGAHTPATKRLFRRLPFCSEVSFA